ncbi:MULTISPECIES: threonine/serine dehydratase [unclassified Leisingera]|uniref:threonine/serine dehydratase n=1 Tax=unclassified Leisingera TaxID=2614906 RepID=UPI0002F8BE70|nr:MULTISPECIES: threonine/serine dehydratase [unclassified Leisingera]KIC24225.1 threonine dehydratase [Leisingera sp. ANG-S3]KIC52941.1 threonine dehydratase [Leisingera sp. ANG-S]KID07341.1 threonine dehydratase [Leisingera sp. ANG1]
MNWQDEIKAAAERIRPHVQQTPVMQTRGFGLDYPVELKLEHMQHTGSFKARGAFNTLLSQEVPAGGLVAASGGNHGAAVAHAAHQLGHRARIYVPEMAGPAKISLIERTGADLQVVPGAYANALEQAQAYEAETGAMQVHAYDAPATVAGQGTCFAEWQAQGLQADTLLIAVGGGGLIAGALAWFQGARKIIAVEPETSCALNAALAAGQPVDVEVSGVAANALGAKQIGNICFELAAAQGVTSLTVPDSAITQAQTALWRERRILVEPAGATALASLMCGAYRPEPGERVAVLVCGGNIAPDPLG